MKKKVLIIYNKVWPYRVKIFEEINKRYDLTVAYNDPKFIGQKFNFQTLFLKTSHFGPITLHKRNLHKLASNFDVVIGISNIGWLSLMRLGFLKKRKYALIYWGIGVRASYENRYDAENRVDGIRYFLTKKADAMIFYSDYPVKKYMEKGFEKNRLFVADNTVYAPFNDNLSFDRQNFIFIGTLYKEKGIEVLLEAYKSLNSRRKNLPVLKIVGGGENFENIQNWIERNNLSKMIHMLGPIYDVEKIEELFRTSIACISPNQAGLSVLSSMAYGSIFITRQDAFTGGEIFNVRDQLTGLFYDGTKEDLEVKMSLVIDEKELASKISLNAMDHYKKNRTYKHMAGQIMSAVDFVLNKDMPSG